MARTSALGRKRIPGELAPALVRAISKVQTQGAPSHASQAGQHLTINLVLRRSDQAGFERYVHAVADRSSPLYRHFLSPAQQAARFGPSSSTYRALRSWLSAKGLAVVQRSSSRLTLTVRGTRSAAERAFDTPIENLRVGGRSIFANARGPALPDRLATSVQSVLGLSDAAQPAAVPADQHLCQSKGALAPTPGNQKFLKTCGNLCRAYDERMIYTGLVEVLFEALLAVLPPVFSLANTAVNGPNSAGGLVGYCFGVAIAQAFPGFGNLAAGHLVSRAPARALAGVSPQTQPGPAHQRIGLLEFDTYSPSDVADWLQLVGLEAGMSDQLHEVAVNGGVASPGAGESEVLLDIDTVMGAAPGSEYVVYDAPPSTSFVQMFQAMIEGGDTVISNSWTQCEDQTPIAEAQAIDSVLASAAASGITVLNGTGDGGSSCIDGSPETVGVPADSPHATAVGGTSPTFGEGLTYGSESWWDEQQEEVPGGAGGYGTSRYFPSPSYQSGLTTAAGRSVPDITFTADPHAGVALCQADGGGCPDGQLWGGTSMAVPGVAGLVADLNEALGHNVGDLGETLYPLAGTEALHSAASMGSDFAHVGLGTPDFAAIYEQLKGEAAGAASASQSVAAPLGGEPQANGEQEGVVRVNLEDAQGLPVGGQQVTLAPEGTTSAKVSRPSANTDPTDGAAVFTITDTTPETVTFSVHDTSDGVTLDTHPRVVFVEPVAAGAEISAEPTSVENNGDATATVTVYLENSLGRPAVGKEVTLSGSGSNVQISPAGSGPSGQTAHATTDAGGYATFTATDTAEESVAFTASDTSDGDLPVPGSATVTFEPGASSSSCMDGVPTATSPFSVSPWASGFDYNPQALDIDGVDFYACSGLGQPAYDSSGNLYVPDSVSGEIYVLGPSGGTVSAADALPDAHFSVGQLGGLAFGKNGELYAGLAITEGSFFEPEIVQLDPTTGAIERVLATSTDGLNDCPFYIATDSLSGDLFVTDTCTFGNGDELERISKPASSEPKVSAYTEALPWSGGLASAGIALAPDGTIYVALPAKRTVVSISASDEGTPKVSAVASLPGETFGVAVASANADGQATSLDISDEAGEIDRVVGVSEGSPSAEGIASGGGNLTGAVLGPDGCVYVDDLDQLLRLTNGGTCAGSTAHTPQISLSASGPSPAPTGASATFTAQLEHFPAAAGTPVTFEVTGANAQVKLVHTGAGDSAQFSYIGALTGGDEVRALAESEAGVKTSTVSSAALTQLWSAGRHLSALSLNGSQESGALGQPAMFTVSLIDVSEPSPIVGASVLISVGSQSCTVTTDASGVGSCRITPPPGQGLDAVTAGYAGNSTYTESSATDFFAAGGVGLAPTPEPPQPAPPSSPQSTLPPLAPTEVKKAGGAPRPLAEVLGLPSAHQCVSKRELVVHVHAPPGQKLLSVRLTLGKKLLRFVTFTEGKDHKIPSTVVDLKGLPKGTFKLKIVVKTRSGKLYTATRTYHTCVAAKKAPSKQPAKH